MSLPHSFVSPPLVCQSRIIEWVNLSEQLQEEDWWCAVDGPLKRLYFPQGCDLMCIAGPVAQIKLSTQWIWEISRGLIIIYTASRNLGRDSMTCHLSVCQVSVDFALSCFKWDSWIIEWRPSAPEQGVSCVCHWELGTATVSRPFTCMLVMTQIYGKEAWLSKQPSKSHSWSGTGTHTPCSLTHSQSF